MGAASFAAACEPCAGMGECFGDPHLSVNGLLFDDASGARVSGARIDFVRTGGTALATDSVRVLTDDNGNFVLTVAAAAAGEVIGDFVIRSPGANPPAYEYRIVNQPFGTFLEIGDAHVFPPWSTRPSLPDIAQLLRAGAPVANAIVEFRRTRGVQLDGGNVFIEQTDGGGVFSLFENFVQPMAAGDLFGDLYVDGVLSYRDAHLIATPLFRPNVTLRVFDLADPNALSPKP